MADAPVDIVRRLLADPTNPEVVRALVAADSEPADLHRRQPFLESQQLRDRRQRVLPGRGRESITLFFCDTYDVDVSSLECYLDLAMRL